nr:alpha/beta-hydrolase N-terminal domain-containing protein [Ruegeria arenilitoris]
MVQGLLGGILVALGYLLGRVFELIWQAADLPRMRGRLALVGNIVFAALVAGFSIWALTFSFEWQNELRAKMGMELADAKHLAQILLAGTGTFALFFLIGALVAALFRWVRGRFYRFMPPRRANVLGVVTVALLLFVVTRDGIFDRVVTGLDESYEAAQMLFDVAPDLPERPDQAGSEASLIDWAAMGQPGRDFVLGGPDAKRFPPSQANPRWTLYGFMSAGQTASHRKSGPNWHLPS